MKLRNIQHIRYKRFFFTVNDSFLSSEPCLDADINYCIQVPKNTEDKLGEFHTLLIDLTQEPDKIKEQIYHRTLTEIKSFLNNQEFEHKILQDIKDVDLRHYIKLFNDFADVKKIRKAEVHRLKAYNRENILAISFIKQKEKPLCINFYRVTKNRATNLHSFSIPQDLSASQSGRAHRALHWLDILSFKESGIDYYDFGGWYHGQDDKALLNVNRFKEQFTKNKVKEFTGVIYKNPVLILLQKFVS